MLSYIFLNRIIIVISNVFLQNIKLFQNVFLTNLLLEGILWRIADESMLKRNTFFRNTSWGALHRSRVVLQSFCTAVKNMYALTRRRGLFFKRVGRTARIIVPAPRLLFASPKKRLLFASSKRWSVIIWMSRLDSVSNDRRMNR